MVPIAVPGVVRRSSVTALGEAFGPQRQLCQAEVENFGLSAAEDENVRWLDIAVHDPFAMCGFQPVGNLDGQIQQLVKAKRSACDPLFQRLAFKQFHDNELPA